jgi:hypothetical protein
VCKWDMGLVVYIGVVNIRIELTKLS